MPGAAGVVHDGEGVPPMIPPVGGGIAGPDTIMHNLGVGPRAIRSG